MIQTPFDQMTDALADAALTPEEREIWQDHCAQLISAQAHTHELERRINTLKAQIKTESPLQTILARPDFNREVARILAMDDRYGTVSSVIYFDIENLEAIKKRHGKDLVNGSIRTVCDTLMAHVRRTDIIGRLAPDEIGVLMPRCNNEPAWQKGEELAKAIHQALSESWGPNLKPEVSFGAYTFRDHEDVSTGLKKAADGMTKLQK